MLLRVGLLSLVLGFGCGPVVGGEGGTSVDGSEGETGRGDASTSTTGPTTPPPSTGSTGTSPSTVTTVDPTDDSSVDTATFISSGYDGTDTACFVHDAWCDLWQQDCCEGEKCMPWANDGGNAWNATRCSPIEASPDAIGQPCTVEGSGVSGIDSCELGAMCFDVDPATNTGVCVGFCEGTPSDASCPTACDACHISNDGVLILCRPICHPGQDDCGPDASCVDLDGAFQCVGFVGDAGVGEPCDGDLACGPGLACVPADAVPSCDGPSCCTPWCDTNAPDACDAMVAGTTCTAATDAASGACNPGIGRCVMPPA